MKTGKTAALLLSALLLAGSLPGAARAAEGGYVLMNVPYSAFYSAELGEGDAPDAVSAATKTKRSNGNLALGSYHVGAQGAGIDGVTYPVYVPDMTVLDQKKEITDASRVEITNTARGQTTTSTYEGSQALFEADDYAWYRLKETPSHYKALTVNTDGTWAFGAVQGETKQVPGVTSQTTYNGRHTEVEMVLSGTEGIASGDAVSAVVVTTSDGAKYGLGHVTNIWRGVELGWNGDDVMRAGNGAVHITNLRYYTPEAVIDYPVDIDLAARDQNGYTDVPSDAWYAPYVDWASAKGYISSARSRSTSFGADNTLTRAEIMTALWNAAGKPNPESSENPFPQDVVESASYYKAVVWAKENGLTEGTGGGSFSPDLEVDRATMVTFLWKQAGQKAPETGKNPFADVAEDAWYRDAVLWSVENDITEGTGSGFSPTAKVTRAQLVGFLYNSNDIFTRAAGKDGTAYENLFSVILDEQYNAVWEKYVAQAAGTDRADPAIVEGLKASISGDLYGQAAIDAYSGSGSMRFDCWYINNLETITFLPGLTAAVTRSDGASQTYHYRYIGPMVVGEGETMQYQGEEFPVGMACDVYESEEDAGEFRYILLMPDTMDTTYHIEFRYGSDLEQLKGYFVGDYAYWLAAGIDTQADAETIDNVIELFCTENVQ